MTPNQPFPMKSPRICSSLALASLLCLSSRVSAQISPAPKPPQAQPSIHALFDGILKKHVRGGLVAYPQIRKQDQTTLRSYLESMSQVDVIKLPRKAQLAFYLNVYNAAMIQAVLDHTAKNPKWTPAANEFAVFKEKRVKLSGGATTLLHLKNQILRSKFKDARMHGALVSGGLSCPPLLARAYVAKDLDKQLDANLKAFLRDPQRNQIDATTKTVRLSKLFEELAKDFGGEAGIRRLLKREFGDAVARYKIAYLPQSWQLNAQPTKQ